jgi:hypothetical protein
MTRILERHAANERIRQEQQGLGKPIIADRFHDYQIVAVGNTIHWSKKAKTFPDFLGEYVKHVLGEDWGNAELAKPLEQRHPLLQWYDSYCRYQTATIAVPGHIADAEVTGVVASYLGTAYGLYLLGHNVELQTRLIKRLKNPRAFQGAYYELIVANTLIRAGFKLILEDETDSSVKHCEFGAISQRTGKKYWVEAKMRGVVGFLGRDTSDGTSDPNPMSAMVRHLNEALRKPAVNHRLIFIDLNTELVIGSDGQPSWMPRVFQRLERFEQKELAAGLSAYVFVTNVPFHRSLGQSTHVAVAPFGLGIPDFNRPGCYRLSETYRQRREHVDAFDILNAFAKYPQLPSTFDGSLRSAAHGGTPPVVIGETYAFRGIKNLPGSPEGDLVGTVTAAAVVESDKMVFIGVKDTLSGGSFLLKEPMTDQQLADYRAHPESYFGKLQYVGKQANTPYELFEFFMESCKSLGRETLLQRLANRPNVTTLAAMSSDDLLAEYCEGMVAATPMPR